MRPPAMLKVTTDVLFLDNLKAKVSNNILENFVIEEVFFTFTEKQ